MYMFNGPSAFDANGPAGVKSGAFFKNVHFRILTFLDLNQEKLPKCILREQTCILFNNSSRIWFYQVTGLFIYSRNLEFYALSLSKVLKNFPIPGNKVGKIVQFMI